MPVLSLRQAGDFQPPEPPSQEYLDESNVASILGLTGAFTFLAVGVVCLRLFVRSYMLRFVGADDWTMLAAVLMALGTFICLCGESQYGMGRHWEWPEPWMFMPYLKWLFAHNLLVMWGVLLVKISIAIFLMRIMLQKFWKIFLWSSVAFLTCFALTCSGTLIFSCIPVSASWDYSARMDPSTKCFSNRTFGDIGLFNSIVNIITDIVFAVIPVPIILRLQVNKKTKFSLIIILSLGLFACAAGIIKARLQAIAFETPDHLFENRFHVWFVIELCLGILAASLPTLKPLFAAVLEGTRSRLATRSRSHATGGPSRASRLRAHTGLNAFPEPADVIELQRHAKGDSATGMTTTDATSVAGSADGDGKPSFNLQVTCGRADVEEREQWDSISGARNDSEERLHNPVAGVYKRVEMTHVSEAAK